MLTFEWTHTAYITVMGSKQVNLDKDLKCLFFLYFIKINSNNFEKENYKNMELDESSNVEKKNRKNLILLLKVSYNII